MLIVEKDVNLCYAFMWQCDMLKARFWQKTKKEPHANASCVCSMYVLEF
jgi:hypothetical protein